jgi:hypothetical protein
MAPIYLRTASELDGNGATDQLVYAADTGPELPVNGSAMVAENGRRRLGEIGRVRGEVGRIEPEESAVAQLERRLESGIQLDVSRGDEGHPSVPAGTGDLEAKRLGGSRLPGARSQETQKSDQKRWSHSARSPWIRRSQSW